MSKLCSASHSPTGTSTTDSNTSTPTSRSSLTASGKVMGTPDVCSAPEGWAKVFEPYRYGANCASAKRPGTRWLFGVIALLALLAGCGDGRPGQSEAVDACRDAIRGQLTNPATADFQSVFTTTYEEHENGYDVSGSVSAENDFGVKTDFTFSCTLDKDGVVLTSYVS